MCNRTNLTFVVETALALFLNFQKVHAHITRRSLAAESKCGSILSLRVENPSCWIRKFLIHVALAMLRWLEITLYDTLPFVFNSSNKVSERCQLIDARFS